MKTILEPQKLLNTIQQWDPEEIIFFKIELEKIAIKSFFAIVDAIRKRNKKYSASEVMKDVNEAIKEVRQAKRDNTHY